MKTAITLGDTARRSLPRAAALTAATNRPKRAYRILNPPEAARMELRTKSQVLDALIAKFKRLPQKHPDRGRLIRMILDLRREIERRPALAPAPGDC